MKTIGIDYSTAAGLWIAFAGKVPIVSAFDPDALVCMAYDMGYRLFQISDAAINVILYCTPHSNMKRLAIKRLGIEDLLDKL